MFFIRKEKSTDEIKAPVYLRITVNGKRAELSIKRDVNINNWINGGRANKSHEIKTLNEYLTIWENRTYQAQKKSNHPTLQ